MAAEALGALTFGSQRALRPLVVFVALSCTKVALPQMLLGRRTTAVVPRRSSTAARQLLSRKFSVVACAVPLSQASAWYLLRDWVLGLH